MKKRLTVGLFMEHYDPFVSGVITSTKALKHELQRRGHKVYIIAPSVSGYQDTDPAVIRISSFALKAMENTTIGFPLPSDYKKLEKIKFDVLHSQEIFTCAGMALRLSRRRNVPYIQSYHTLWDRFLTHYSFPFYVNILMGVIFAGMYTIFLGPKQAVWLFFGRARSRNNSYLANLMWRHMVCMAGVADSIVSPSAFLKETLEKERLKTPVYNVPNGLPAEKNLPPRLLPHKSSKLRVLSVARLSPEKRVDVLIKAIVRDKDMELILVGEGPERIKLHALVDKLKLMDRVKFIGELDNLMVHELMHEADVLALASYNFDNQPVVILEALQAGLPIIYCDPKLREGLTESNSLLVDKSPRGFADGMKKLKNPAIRAKMGEAGRKLSGQFNIRLIADRMLNVYEKTEKPSK